MEQEKNNNKKEIQLILRNEFGEFQGKKFIIDEENYKKFIDMTKKYYLSGFELTMDDGTFCVFSPELVRKSMLSIKTKDV
jgi:hypothetical protein